MKSVRDHAIESESRLRNSQVKELASVVQRVVGKWPRDVRVPTDLQFAIANAILDHIQ